MTDDTEGMVRRAQAAKYKPEHARCLFIAEAPPIPLERYFYFESVTEHDWLWIGLMKGLFPNEFGETRNERLRKPYWLKKFRDCGYQLIDAVKEPLHGTPNQRVAVIRRNASALMEEVRTIAPDQIVLIKSTVHEALFHTLRAAGLPAINDEALPFPSSGRQKQFHVEIRKLIQSGELPVSRENARVPRILIVDDEEPIREIVRSMLVNAGYQCEAASDGLDALAILNSSRPFDLLLTNLLMPHMDGFSLLERVKNEFPEMAVVFETAVKDSDVTLAAYRNGAYDYLLKPYTRWQLVTAVRRALEDQRLKMEIRSCHQSEDLVGPAREQKPPRILVVDPDSTLREKMCSGLVAEGYECTEASTGRQAIFFLETRGQFDLLLTGETLPEISGASVFEIAKKKYPDMVAIMDTGVQDISRAESAIRNGFFDCIWESFPLPLLSIIVRRALEHRRLALEGRRLKLVDEKEKREIEYAETLVKRYQSMRTAFDDQKLRQMFLGAKEMVEGDTEIEPAEKEMMLKAYEIAEKALLG